jgi:hypothetical protein
VNGGNGKNRAGDGESKHSPWKDLKFKHIAVVVLLYLVVRAIYYPVAWILFICLMVHFQDKPALPVVFGIVAIGFGETAIYYLGVPLLSRIMHFLFPELPVDKPRK